MITIIIFDADGVLINGKLFSDHLEQDYGISVATTKSFFSCVFMDCVTGKKELKEVLPPYLEQWGWKGSVAEFIDYWHRSEHTIDEKLVGYIQQLRKQGIICCLATNQTKDRFEYMLHEMGFGQIFDKLYASAHVGHRKPEMEFYQKVIVDLGVDDKKEVLFWDDSQQNIDNAKKYRIHAEKYTSFDDFQKTMQEVYKIAR